MKYQREISVANLASGTSSYVDMVKRGPLLINSVHGRPEAVLVEPRYLNALLTAVGEVREAQRGVEAALDVFHRILGEVKR